MLYFVNYFTPSIISLTWQAFSIFVGKDRSHSFHYLLGGEILRGYQFNPVLLSFLFFFDEVEDYFILFHERFLEKRKNRRDKF